MLKPMYQDLETGVEAGLNSCGDLYLSVKNEYTIGGFNMADTPENRRELKEEFYKAVSEERKIAADFS